MTVRALREAIGVQQSQFAIRCGVSQAYLNNIEAGRREPRPNVTAEIARQLGVPVDAITYPKTQEEKKAA